MVSELQRQVAEALAGGTSLDEVERTIINRTPLDEEQRAALWLYADALLWQPAARARLEAGEPALFVG